VIFFKYPVINNENVIEQGDSNIAESAHLTPHLAMIGIGHRLIGGLLLIKIQSMKAKSLTATHPSTINTSCGDVYRCQCCFGIQWDGA